MPMKKIFTLLTAALLAFTANAQVAFTDANGKEYADGETMVINAKIETDEVYGDDVYFEGPILVNNGKSTVSVKMDVNIVSLPENTKLADCFSGQCVNYYETGSHSTSTKEIAAGKNLPTTIEWNCMNDKDYSFIKGTAVVEYTLYVNGSKDKTVTVKFVYGEEADLNEVESELTVVAAYSITGQLVDPSTRGIVLQKMSNGTIRKVINR